jgi:hypothetical protein
MSNRLKLQDPLRRNHPLRERFIQETQRFINAELLKDRGSNGRQSAGSVDRCRTLPIAVGRPAQSAARPGTRTG